jgi:hypothetical protein
MTDSPKENQGVTQALINPSFLQRYSKSRACWASERNVKDFAGVRNECFWWRRNRRWVLVSTHHGILENVCPFGRRYHTEDAAGSLREKLWSQCSSSQRNSSCSMFFQEVAHSIRYISSITYSTIWKQQTWFFGVRRPGQLFGCTWIIPYALPNRRLRQKLRKFTFPGYRTSPIHQI